MASEEDLSRRVLVQFLGDRDSLKIIRDITRSDTGSTRNGRPSSDLRMPLSKRSRGRAADQPAEKRSAPVTEEQLSSSSCKAPSSLLHDATDEQLAAQKMYEFHPPGRKRRPDFVGADLVAAAQVRDNGEVPKRMRATPRRLKERNPVNDDTESESSSEPENGNDDDDDRSEPEESHGDRSAAAASKRGEQTVDRDPDVKIRTLEGAEDYFLAHTSKPHTSDHTLARLDLPRMDHATLGGLLSGHRELYAEETEALYKEHRALFARWMVLLCNGFNLLLHGFGSKRRLIEDFRCTMCTDFMHVVVNGYFPSLTVRSILGTITSDCLGSEETFADPSEQIAFIHMCLKNKDVDLFLFVHNVDGVMLRNDNAQTVLSVLAQSPRVHLIASMDHINAPLIWDMAKLNRFGWLWFDCTTYEHYSLETSYEDSLMMQSVGALALSSLLHVVRSLTPNARSIFNLLVNYQLENESSGTYIGMPFQMLYQRCREGFLVNSDLTLRAQLTEFRDHKLIRSRKGFDGAEHVYLLSSSKTLRDFLEQLNAA